MKSHTTHLECWFWLSFSNRFSWLWGFFGNFSDKHFKKLFHIYAIFGASFNEENSLALSLCHFLHKMTKSGVVYMERKNERYCIVVVSSPFPLLPHTTDLCIRDIHHLFLFEITLVPHQYDLFCATPFSLLYPVCCIMKWFLRVNSVRLLPYINCV